MASGTISGGTYNARYSYFMTWTSVSNGSIANTSNVTLNWVFKKTASDSYNAYNTSGSSKVTLVINGSSSGSMRADFDLRSAAVGTEKVIATYTVNNIPHNADGTCTINVSGSHVTGLNWGTKSIGNTAITLDTIPRYATCSQSLSDTNENDMTINWSSDSTIDHIWYSIDNGANWTDVGAVWTNQGTYVIYNLNANTTYNIKTRVRRADSQLTTDSAVAGWTTLAYPYISGLGATSLTIGNNQTLYLYNPKGRQITVYMKKDGYDGNQIFSQTITNNSNTPFTFTPNASTMYNLIPNSRSANCVYYVVYGSNRSGTANGNFVVNENNNRPSISSFTTNDNNSTYSLTNDHSKIVLNATNMSLTINGSGQNGASISGISVNNVALTVSNNSGTYTLNKPPSATFNVVLTDSRGIQTNTNITLQNYVAYFEPILNTNAVRNQPTDGILNLSGNGSFYNGSFGAENNTLDVQYTVTEQSTGTVLETGYMSLTPSGNDFTLQDLQVSNANYQKQYVVSFNAIDKLNTITKNITIPKGQPVFWWNESYFDINANTAINGTLLTNTPTNQNIGLTIKSSNYNESSIKYEPLDGTRSMVVGYGTSSFDGFGIYSWLNAKNVFTVNHNGDTAINGELKYTGGWVQSGSLNDIDRTRTATYGVYSPNNSVSDRPTSDHEVGCLKVICWGGNPDWCIQEYQGIYWNTGTKKWVRTHDPNGWTNWQLVSEDTGWVDLSANVNSAEGFAVRPDFPVMARRINGIVYWRGMIYSTTAKNYKIASILLNIPTQFCAYYEMGRGGIMYDINTKYYMYQEADYIRVTQEVDFRADPSWYGFNLTTISGYPQLWE